MCDLENVGQGHDVQHSQWCHSMAHIWHPLDGNSNVGFLTIYEIFTNENAKNLTGNVWFYTDDFFRMLASGHIRLCKKR